MLVVQAAAVTVDEPPLGGGDEVTVGRDAVLQRHADQANRATGLSGLRPVPNVERR